MKMRQANPVILQKIDLAIIKLREARDLLKFADCPKTLQRVRLALTSAGGAYRHGARRVHVSARDGGPQWEGTGHARAAEREGWSIFTSGTDQTDPHVERDDEADKLSGDAEACALVMFGTKPHHAAAREFIGWHNPEALELMREEAESWRLDRLCGIPKVPKD